MSVKRPLVLILLSSLFGALGVVLLAPAATAADCVAYGDTDPGNRYVYGCIEYSGGGEVPGDPVTGPSKPPCKLDAEYDDLCLDKDACWMNDPAAVQDPKELEGTPKPEPDSHVVYIKCITPDGDVYDRWYWNQDVPTITFEDRLRSALGAIDFPTIQASFNPPTRTLVNLPTWWWAENAPPGEIRGSSALGLIGYAVPRGLSVVPGDGGPAFSCPLSVTKSDTCTYDYRRSGDFTATVSIVYDIRFEVGGEEIELGNVPAELRTVTVDDEVPVTVLEVQTRVTKVR